jgi:hypothetical protein
MAKRIEIGLPNQVYKRVEDLAASADMKVTEVARMGPRWILADLMAF